MTDYSVSLSSGQVFRVTRDIFVEELVRSRRDSFHPADAVAWTPATSVGADGLGLDSLERFTLASRLNEQFHLYESGVEDNLLRARTLGDTVDVVVAGRELANERISFMTGGSTGTARVVTHLLANLSREAAELVGFVGKQHRVRVTVPVHHIYGFIFGVLLPEALGAEVVDAQYSLLGGAGRPAAGELVVSVPFLWERLPVASWPPGVCGTSSTAPFPAELSAERGRQLDRLIEVYGSSETSGVGWRDHARAPGEDAAFTLLSRWRRDGERLRDLWAADSDPSTASDRSTASDPLAGSTPSPGPAGPVIETPDHLVWVDDIRFHPRGRRDAVIQVGGVNVDLEALRDRIRSLVPEAHDVAVRPDGAGRIRVFLAGDSSHLPDDATVRRRLSAELDAAALPSSIARGPQLPRSLMGKLADW